MKLLLPLLFVACMAFGQPAPTPITNNGFVAVGGGWNPYTHPQVTGWASYAYLINEKQEIYWFTTEDITSASKHPFTIQTSVRTGLATPLKTIGRLKIMGLLDVGGASSVLSSAGAASAGSISLFKVTKNFYMVGGFRIIKVGTVSGTPKLYEFGFGYSF